MFEQTPYGKPHLVATPKGPPGLLPHFNLTHTDSIIGCAVSSGVEVGLDVEEVARQPRNLMRLAKRRFSEEEYKALAAVESEAARTDLFMKIWTLKEAFVKARGTGINAPPGLRGFTIGLIPDPSLSPTLGGLSNLPHKETPLRISCELKEPDGHHYDFLLFQPSPHHVAALCLRHPGDVAGADVHEEVLEEEGREDDHQDLIGAHWGDAPMSSVLTKHQWADAGDDGSSRWSRHLGPSLTHYMGKEDQVLDWSPPKTAISSPLPGPWGAYSVLMWSHRPFAVEGPKSTPLQQGEVLGCS